MRLPFGALADAILPAAVYLQRLRFGRRQASTPRTSLTSKATEVTSLASKPYPVTLGRQHPRPIRPQALVTQAMKHESHHRSG